MSPIINENVLLESSSARNELFSTRTENYSRECINKAKTVILATWKATDYGTTEYVAKYYEVGLKAIASLYTDHKEEFVNEVVTVTGKELRELKSSWEFSSNTPHLMLWSARAIHRVGFLLRDSEVAKEVRTVTLNVVESASQLIPTNPQPTEDEIETFQANQKEIANLQRAISRLELKSQFNVTFSYVTEWKVKRYKYFSYSYGYNYDIYEACIVNEIYTKVFGGTKSELCKKMNLPVDKFTNIRDHIPLHALEALRMFEKYFKQLIVVMEIEPHKAIELALKSIQADADWCGVSFPIEFNRAKAITCPSTYSEEDWINHWRHELGERKEAVKLFLIKYDGYEPKALLSE